MIIGIDQTKKLLLLLIELKMKFVVFLMKRNKIFFLISVLLEH